MHKAKNSDLCANLPLRLKSMHYNQIYHMKFLLFTENSHTLQYSKLAIKLGKQGSDQFYVKVS